ncbi:MAG: DNA internalization-related competence protein ComEC/Rec2 [Syntrophales bacterium]|nr:DNA internalization-related competence protein ComEC/Rec2 [Syntrophales bacterium]
MKGFGEIWVRRPVLWILFAYSTGLAASICFQSEPVYIWIGMIVALLAALLYRRKALFPMLLILVALFGCFRGTLNNKIENPLTQYSDQRITIQGTVTGAPQVEPDRTVYVLNVSAVLADEAVYPVNTKVKVSHYPTTYSPVPRSSSDPIKSQEQKPLGPYATGDVLQVSGVLKEPSGQRNPKGFDYKAYLTRRGIYNTMSVTGRNAVFIKRDNSFSVDRIFAWFRSRAETALDRSVGGREGDFLKAMLLGQRWLVDPGTGDDFTRTGLAHVLAVSGLHVGYVVLLLGFLCSIFRLKKWTGLILQITALAFYCVLVGAAPSVIRAVTMTVIYYVGKALGRKTDILNSAGVAALAILLFKPMDILEVGFQLSFAAVCSIALYEESIRHKLAFLPSRISSMIAVTLSAQLGTLPLTVYYFNILSPVSLLANLIVIPFIGFAVLGGFILLPFAIALPGMAGVIGTPLRLLCTLILSLAKLPASLPYSYIRVISPSMAVMLVFYAVFWLLSRERPGFIKRPYFLCVLLASVLLAGHLAYDLLASKELKIVFLDVGQGDCSLIQTPDGKNILIDGGGRQEFNSWNKRILSEKESSNTVNAAITTGRKRSDSGNESINRAGSDIGEDTVVPFLLKNGISSLDLVIMSHSHDDHIGGLLPVMEQLKVQAFMEYPPGEESPSYQVLKDTLKRKGTEVITAGRGQSYRIGKEVWFHILYPDDKVVKALSKGNENNYSLVILVEYRYTYRTLVL